MKPLRVQRFSIMCAMLTLCITAVLAQEFGPGSFDVSWNTVDGGGGTSTGGVFELTGTIGQPDAGVVMSGGGFEVRGGFWAGGVEPVETCPADIAPPPNGDGLVGVPDLLAVINAWGICSPPCTADIAPPSGDGTVGVPDLLAVINAWGSCD